MKGRHEFLFRTNVKLDVESLHFSHKINKKGICLVNSDFPLCFSDQILTRTITDGITEWNTSSEPPLYR